MSSRSLQIALAIAACAVGQAHASDGFQAAMLAAVNAERAAAGLQPLCTNKKLQTAAQLHSDDMANKNFMSHTGSSGSTFTDRIQAQSFDWGSAAENVAAGQINVEAVVKSWMTSDGHKANILGDSKFFGMGYTFCEVSTYKHYWTQDFATGDGEVCDGDSDFPPTSTSPATPAPVIPVPSSAAPTTTSPPDTAPPPTTPPATLFPRANSSVTQQSPSSSPTPASTAPSTTTKSIQQQLLDAVNAERAAAGLQPLCMNKKLQAAAQLHSDDMANKNFISHTGSSGSTMGGRITAQGFAWNAIAENVAAGQINVESVVKSWMSSSGHSANILGQYKFFGMGYAFCESSTYKRYWTQDFGNGANEVCG